MKADDGGRSADQNRCMGALGSSPWRHGTNAARRDDIRSLTKMDVVPEREESCTDDDDCR